MKVYVKSTDYQADQITMSMRGEGGTSVYGDEDIPNFALLEWFRHGGGCGRLHGHSSSQGIGRNVLEVGSFHQQRGTAHHRHLVSKRLGDDASVGSSLFHCSSQGQHGVRGNDESQPFAPEEPQRQFRSVVYNDSLSATLYDHNVRKAPVTVEIAKKADYNRIFEIYRERFSDASNFKTVFIGKVDMAQLRPLLCQYLATPAFYPQGRKEQQGQRASDCEEERGGEVRA